jgi:hypothetical protein
VCFSKVAPTSTQRTRYEQSTVLLLTTVAYPQTSFCAHYQESHEPLHACIKSIEHSDLTKETLKTLQVLVFHGATLAGEHERWAWEEAPAVRLCIFLWVEELAYGVEFSDVPVEVITQSADSTQAFIAKLRSSPVIVRHKI